MLHCNDLYVSLSRRRAPLNLLFLTLHVASACLYLLREDNKWNKRRQKDIVSAFKTQVICSKSTYFPYSFIQVSLNYKIKYISLPKWSHISRLSTKKFSTLLSSLKQCNMYFFPKTNCIFILCRIMCRRLIRAVITYTSWSLVINHM